MNSSTRVLGSCESYHHSHQSKTILRCEYCGTLISKARFCLHNGAQLKRVQDSFLESLLTPFIQERLIPALGSLFESESPVLSEILVRRHSGEETEEMKHVAELEWSGECKSFQSFSVWHINKPRKNRKNTAFLQKNSKPFYCKRNGFRYFLSL